MRIIAALLALMLILGLVGCGTSGSITGSTDDQPTLQSAHKDPVIQDPPPPGDPHDLGGGFRDGG
ncbi:MAG: hypothetical protein R3F48_14325 [Candidatus Zixiibacteriota bacterium]